MKQVQSFWRQQCHYSAWVNDSVNVAKLINYEQIKFRYKAEDNSVII